VKIFSAWLALGFGTFLAVAEVVRNAGVVQWWPFWVVDYIAVGLLLWGAASVLWRPGARGLGVLTAAWGFTCAMFYMSLFGHIEEIRMSGVPVEMATAETLADEPVPTIIIGVLLALTVVGLATSLAAELRGEAETRE
jgi:hypothetical protein